MTKQQTRRQVLSRPCNRVIRRGKFREKPEHVYPDHMTNIWTSDTDRKCSLIGRAIGSLALWHSFQGFERFEPKGEATNGHGLAQARWWCSIYFSVETCFPPALARLLIYSRPNQGGQPRHLRATLQRVWRKSWASGP